MSLVDEFKSTCVLLDKTREPDGEGGWITHWKESVKFIAAVVLDSTLEARIAEKQGVTGLYTITTDKSITLEYHDVFKRLYDNKLFRVTSDGDDKATPASATLNMRQVTAEEYELPMEGRV